MFSGGAGSWAAAKLVEQEHADPGDEIVLLFADTLMEDDDLYRFIKEAAWNVNGASLVTVTDGRDPWQVFKDKRFIGNTRIDPCSYYLKRKLMREWLEANCDPADTRCYIGIDWTEAHRYEKAKGYWEPWPVFAPLCDDTRFDKDAILAWLDREGIARPRLYAMGFAHNNCGGFCVKAGQGHFKQLLDVLPERYAYHEAKEEEMRVFLGKDIAILRDRTGGTSRPLTLRELRERVETGKAVDAYDIGGCNCVDPDLDKDKEIESA